MEYFTCTYPNATISKNKQGGDLDVHLDGETTQYEIKGTEENGIAFAKLRVSSKACYDVLRAGMTLVRVRNVGH